MIKFQTSDEQTVLAERKLVIRSVTIQSMIDDNYDPDEAIPLPEITKATFDRVLDYLKHIDSGNAAPDIEKPLRSNDMRDVTTEFYAKFIDLDDDTVQDIILAANYLDIKDLLALGCAKMGSVIRGLTIPEFRKKFNIVNDFTPEEEAEPFDENKLAELAEQYEK
jgi:Skp1 family, dimerisation domain/Skp1 family, tetramerisation domain